MSFLSSTPAWWSRAQAQGLVSGAVPAAGGDEEPGGLVIGLALLGALVCALTAGVFLLALLETDFWFRSPVAYGANALGMVVAAVLLRRGRGVFVTCLALVLWGLFCGLFLLRLDEDVRSSGWQFWLFSGLLAGWQWLGAWAARAVWVKRMLGLVFGISAYLCLQRSFAGLPLLSVIDVAGGLLAVAWWLWLRREPQRLAAQARLPAAMGWAAFADSAAVGLLLMQALGVVRWGMGYELAQELFELPSADTGALRLQMLFLVGRCVASALVLLATALLCRHWARHAMATRQSLHTLLGVGALLAIGAWFSPSLGMIALLGAMALTGGRWRIAAGSGLAALWSLGQFYYSLAWPLAQKGLGLAAMGAVLLLGLYLQHAWAKRRATATAGAAADALLPVAAWSRPRLLWLIAGAVLVFGLVNWDVRGKEQVIAEGQPVLVRLIPVDPRSLMQGDYMALNFSLPTEVTHALQESMAPTALVRARLDDKGEATVVALAKHRNDAGAGEVVLPLKQLKGHWVLVTDAYFFPEGTGAAFEHARFGDFRVLPDGRALLVGLADAQGRAIEVPRAAARPQARANDSMGDVPVTEVDIAPQGPVADVDAEPEAAAAVEVQAPSASKR